MSDIQEFYKTKRDQLVREYEGFRPDPYLDGEGIPTVGYGTTEYPDGAAVTLNDPAVSKDVAEQMMQNKLTEFTTQMETNPDYQNLSPSQKAALGSFAYNTGPGTVTNPVGYETLQSAIKSGDSQQIGDAMSLYINKGSSSEQGLRRRRAAESTLLNELYPAKEKFQSIVDDFNSAINP
jgi:GH24 family phage-related lysozyme (muramidase)